MSDSLMDAPISYSSLGSFVGEFVCSSMLLLEATSHTRTQGTTSLVSQLHTVITLSWQRTAIAPCSAPLETGFSPQKGITLSFYRSPCFRRLTRFLHSRTLRLQLPANHSHICSGGRLLPFVFCLFYSVVLNEFKFMRFLFTSCPSFLPWIIIVL